MSRPLDRLRYHVTGAIERGDAKPIVEVRDERDYGYLQHGYGTAGPFRTERVAVKSVGAGRWHAWYAGRWRCVRFQLGRTFIINRGERITILIEGV